MGFGVCSEGITLALPGLSVKINLISDRYWALFNQIADDVIRNNNNSTNETDAQWVVLTQLWVKY